MKQGHVLMTIGIAVAALIGFELYRSLTPATHTDHDHALENLDAGGFLRLQRADGSWRNMVGAPGKVLVLHWVSIVPGTSMQELASLAEYARAVQSDKDIEIAIIADEPSWDALRQFAKEQGLPPELLHLDPDMRTGKLFGVRRTPETLVYDPDGRLALQARRSLDWGSPGQRNAIEESKKGVDGSR